MLLYMILCLAPHDETGCDNTELLTASLDYSKPRPAVARILFGNNFAEV